MTVNGEHEAVGSKNTVMSEVVFRLTLCAMLFAFCSSAEAQQVKKVSRIGFLSPSSASTAGPNLEALRQGLRDLGYLEGKKHHHRIQMGGG